MASKTKQRGERLDYTPVAAVAAGVGVLRGGIFGVTTQPIAAGEGGSIAITGVHTLDKEADAGVVFADGADVYFDLDNQLAVATSGDGGVNKKIGKADGAAADGDATVDVLLLP